MESNVIAVDAILQLGSVTSEVAIKKAFRFYSATYRDKSDPSISFEVKYKGIQDENQYLLTFLGTGTALTDITEGVHRFMESFLEELYDESVEDDWLCELGCEELPIIIDYDIKSARAYSKDEIESDV
ncbi:hypothetical protein AXX12_04865 [Anaerosporomusa subterranea]|uniref:Uncharacterized protein n=1 Tax=Anaerosporomusa subterranea TaxID=1794912 RepID=A0A154BUA3_ANASB|nr:hypothetical protein [Anaerosporomusa subterranea]KYZ77445.1 hypothetical protein AXX12_04865 [Anaerosporomusa subterranea]